ncbi:MAG TPA: aminomethyl-transferring glycine dehydrogenase [Bacteroidota bacterium]|nr:aminomethyl-transferring glycine dehydrogenase [Bacteroidota bacterium]
MFPYEENFQSRHLGVGEADLQKMLNTIGVSSLDELIDQTIPQRIRLRKPLEIPEGVGEFRFLRDLQSVAARNKVFKSYIGLGYYDTITPSVILRNVFQNPGWYTQYTPYQAEIAQGRLEALLNFQTMVIDLTKLDVANASLLDEGTAAAEAMSMLFGLAQKSTNGQPANKFFVSETCFPQTIDILKTRALPVGIELVLGNHEKARLDRSFFGAIVQYPAEHGAVYDFRSFINHTHEVGAKVVVAADLLSLALLTPPGEFGADVAVGSTQRFGVPLGYGGPHAAYFATRNEFIRQMPGRIIGVSVDAQNNRAYRMTLQTREQHIRREKATSNICTAQALLAIMAGMYAVYHGPQGIKRIASGIHASAKALANMLKELGYTQLNEVYFDTLNIRSPVPTSKIRPIAERSGINFRYIDDKHFGISVDEATLPHDLEAIVRVCAEASGKSMPAFSLEKEIRITDVGYPPPHQRTSDYLQHPVFNQYHSETEMMRYIKMLENKDLSLTHSMIPLGSCTMKLNAATELFPVSWKEFANIHPFVPQDQIEGYRQVFSELESFLCEITGLHACSLQPNSGAQGEFAGLLVIRAYHQDRGEGKRNVALIPSSAHGTNPASAVMAGYKVVVVKCDDMGNIDVDDLRRKAEEHKNDLAALMVTYPSTHGVFEEAIQDMCDIVHKYGGLVYMDGANLNAQVGLTSPGVIGADVCHINLHKTFSIPHGGGGPGMGPICVAKNLAPYLPGHPLVKTGGEKAIHAVSAAPWGSPSILLISYAYIKMLGGKGITEATRYAILNANYLKARLESHYPVLYQGEKGRVAHEFILDPRELKATTGVDVEDIAKRLMDYGFHAPTVSFPVPGTLMIEPTESESKAELDRFADSLIAIRKEIKEIEDGKSSKEDNVLKNAPHTAQAALSEAWNRPYSRYKAVYPLGFVRQNKFWPSVGRINNSYGDRNIVCSCPPIEAYVEEEI